MGNEEAVSSGWRSPSVEVLLSGALLGTLAVLLVPLPSVVLDMLLAFNLAVTILVLVLSVSVAQPLEIAVFPSLLLLLTLFRLALNVATTRLILLNGDAGRIVTAFGDFVVGGNLVVGLVIFLILVVIQFIVITKGATRVSEVAARFVLDAMPGKQMAIDAELGSGAIAEPEARARRLRLTQEAEFYGAMDGAGKFVRGDAVAGLVITAINLIGGVVIGVTRGLSIIDAISTYSVLSVGDGIVTQIPAVLIATASGILVTKSTSKESLGHEIRNQLLARTEPLWIGALIVGGIGLLPGIPKIPFLLVAVALTVTYRSLAHSGAEAKADQAKADSSNTDPLPAAAEHIDNFLQVDRAGMEVGIKLIGFVTDKTAKGIPERITAMRRELSQKYGVWVPAIRVRDNIHIEPETYRFMINGNVVAQGQVRVQKMLAIDPGHAQSDLDGEAVIDPAFHLKARWISPSDQRQAELKGYTVVDPVTVVMTHLGEVLRKYAHELLGRDDLQKMLDRVRESAPALVDELKPEILRPSELHQVLVLLLRERVPISNLPRILETLLQAAPVQRDPAELAERVRQQIGRDILRRHRAEESGTVKCLVLDPRLEAKLRELMHDYRIGLSAAQLESLVESIASEWRRKSLDGQEPVLLCDTALRRAMHYALERSLPDLCVVSYQEVPSDVSAEIVAVIKADGISSDNPPSGTKETSGNASGNDAGYRQAA